MTFCRFRILVLSAIAIHFATGRAAYADPVCRSYDEHLENFVAGIPFVGNLEGGNFIVKNLQQNPHNHVPVIFDISYATGGKTVFTKRLDARKFDESFGWIELGHTNHSGSDALRLRYVNPGTGDYSCAYVLFASKGTLC